MNRRLYKFDEFPRVKMKTENVHAIQLSKSEFLNVYGELLYQKYSTYCYKLSDNSYDSYVPYMKIIFNKRHTSVKQMASQHMIEHEVVVSEVEKKRVKLDVMKTVSKGEVTMTHTHRPRKPNRVTKKMDSISSVTTIESTQEVNRELIIECVPIARLNKVVLCDMSFQDYSEDVGCQTIGNQNDIQNHIRDEEPKPILSVSSVMMQDIQPIIQDVKLEPVMVNSIGIQSFDSYIDISEPKKPMYRHIRNKMGLGKLAERNETIRELWMTQEILSLKSQMRELIESQDSLIMSGRLLDVAPEMSDEVDVIDMQSIMNQVADLTNDPDVNMVTKAYFG
jgi:hypothetical protein